MMLTDFTASDLTAAVNKFPIQWGRVSQLGLFTTRGLRTRTAVVEERSGVLAVLPSHEWGGEGTVGSKMDRKTYAFAIKQTVHEDIVLPDDVQNVRAFGSESELATLPAEIAIRLQRMRAKHDITLEWKRMGALKGAVLNADGSTMVNLFTSFGISQTSVDFVLGTSTTDVRAKCQAVLNQIEDNLMGDSMNGVRVLVSPEFWGKLVAHPAVVDYIKGTPAANAFMQQRLNEIEVFGIVFEQYRATVNSTRFIAANEGHAFPVGTTDTFATYFAPADFNEAVNTIGLPIYVKTEDRPMGRGVTIHTQCNSLPLCHQPAVLVKVTSSN